MVKSRYIGDGHPTFNKNPYNGYINPYYWVDDHPLLYGNNGSLDPGTFFNLFVLHQDEQNMNMVPLLGKAIPCQQKKMLLSFFGGWINV